MTDPKQTRTFDIEQADPETPDIYVTETFEAYGLEKAVLQGETYDAFSSNGDEIRLEWDDSHHTFDGRREEWVIDVDALDELADELDAHGYTHDLDVDGLEEHTGIAYEGTPLHEAVEFADATETVRTDDGEYERTTGDRVTVTYAKKTGNGTATKEGEVVEAGFAKKTDAAGYTTQYDDPSKPRLHFRRDDGNFNYVKFDQEDDPYDRGKVAIFSAGRYPYMGAVQSIEIGKAGGEE